MKNDLIRFNQQLVEIGNLNESLPISNSNSSSLYDENNEYINELNLFFVHFNVIPNIIKEGNIDCKKANIWFREAYKQEIKHYYFLKHPYPILDTKGKISSVVDTVFYVLFDDLIVHFDFHCSTIAFLFHKTKNSQVEKVIAEITRFKKRRQRNKPIVSLLVNTQSGIMVQSITIPKSKLSIKENYNDDFQRIHQTILKRLSKKNDKGLVLLHGKPGTGKTSYIRYLISQINKEVIFLPPNLAASITNPDLLSVLVDHPNSIFVIEDAENIIIDREKEGNSPVSALLNISDGLLSDCLNIQIICSFNTDISKIDNALMRKGRLIAKYEFKELETKKAQALSNKLGFQTEIHEPLTLTTIYNQGEDGFQQLRENKIGFR